MGPGYIELHCIDIGQEDFLFDRGPWCFCLYGAHSDIPSLVCRLSALGIVCFQDSGVSVPASFAGPSTTRKSVRTEDNGISWFPNLLDFNRMDLSSMDSISPVTHPPDQNSATKRGLSPIAGADVVGVSLCKDGLSTVIDSTFSHGTSTGEVKVRQFQSSPVSERPDASNFSNVPFRTSPPTNLNVP